MYFLLLVVVLMKLEWGKKVSCPACAMHMYDLMKSPITCPHCGNVFEASDYKSRKKGSAVDDVVKVVADFEFEDELETDDSTVLDGDDMDAEIDVIKIKEFE